MGNPSNTKAPAENQAIKWGSFLWLNKGGKACQNNAIASKIFQAFTSAANMDVPVVFQFVGIPHHQGNRRQNGTPQQQSCDNIHATLQVPSKFTIAATKETTPFVAIHRMFRDTGQVWFFAMVAFAFAFKSTGAVFGDLAGSYIGDDGCGGDGRHGDETGTAVIVADACIVGGGGGKSVWGSQEIGLIWIRRIIVVSNS